MRVSKDMPFKNNTNLISQFLRVAPEQLGFSGPEEAEMNSCLGRHEPSRDRTNDQILVNET
ncbi:hypothetical protein GCM10007094_09550 [Pseudovibrio japonicus]|uniref:Uncharacterized protein n=1 Tax=Pseudovibrio japonicus TaxID=366534 RepID=A0ABQ3E7K7_9HYPH|nr:hypothetical protein GCM10007094_09550 [Pseudovibrio japonicus]